ISPNQKIPAIVDRQSGIQLMESGAILLYLAQKSGRLLPEEPAKYWETIQWLMWQKGGFGPTLGHALHYLKFNRGKSEYSEERHARETYRLYKVLDRQLAGQRFIVDDEYTNADIASWPWVARHEFQTVDLDDYPNVLAWYLRIANRPAVKAGWSVPVPDEVPMPRGPVAESPATPASRC
ncbi:MAG: glutathione S-transferase, partial [Xanthomonadales bacterium]|nr:glutathione S-transferase [Xanthomonadales bacterium]